MKRLLILCLILILLAAAGCSAASTTGNTDNQATYQTTTAGQWNDDSGAAPTGSGNQDTFARKIVRNASVSLEVKDVPAAYAELLDYAKINGGYEVSHVRRNNGSTITIQAQIKIDPRKLDAFLDFMATVGDVMDSETTSDDITNDYYDAQTRLKTLEMTLETYYGFLEKAVNIDESLKIQNRIDSLTLEIESFKGRIKLWDSLLAESTVTLWLSQLQSPVELKKEINWSTLSFDDMLYLMKSGLTGVLNFIVNALSWIAIALVVTCPLWLAGLVILLIYRHRRKKARQALAAKTQPDSSEAAPGSDDNSQKS